VIEKLLNLEYNEDRQVLRFNDQAKEIFIAWQRQNTDQCNKVDNESVEGIYSKLETYLPRFALIIQLLRWACDEAHRECIDGISMNSAVQLIEYFRENALKVHRHLNTSPVEKLPEDRRKFYEALPLEFATSEAEKIAEELGFDRRRLFEFFKDQTLFVRLRHGRYQRTYP
jgi:hypothetical protein